MEIPYLGSVCPYCKADKSEAKSFDFWFWTYVVAIGVIGGYGAQIFGGIGAVCGITLAVLAVMHVQKRGKWRTRQPAPPLDETPVHEAPVRVTIRSTRKSHIDIPTPESLMAEMNSMLAGFPAFGDQNSAVDRLAQLDEMRDRGLISDEEYAAKKAQILEQL